MVSLTALRELELEYAGKRCASHPDGRLAVLAGSGSVTVWCAGCKGAPGELVHIASYTERYKTGQGLPAAVRSRLAAKHGEWTMTTEIALRDPTSVELAQITTRFAAQMPTYDEQAWKALKPADVQLAAKLCLAGFQPFHFTVMAYRSKGVVVASLHINLQGREFNARRAMMDRFGGVTVRALSAQERIDWQLDDDEVGAIATLWERDPRNGARWEAMQDIGRAGGKRDAGETRKDPQTGREYQAGGNPIARANRQEQAFARARARVLINGAPLGVPIGTYTGYGGDVIEGDSRTLPDDAHSLAAIAEQTNPEADVGTDTPAEVFPVAPEATDTVVQAAAPVQSAAVASVASGIPTLTPARNARPMADVRKDQGYARELVDAIKASGVTSVREFGYSLQLGMDAVYQLAADGYAVEQIVAIVSGKANPSLGW